MDSLSINNVKKLSIFFENSAEASSEIVEVITYEPTTCTPPTSLVSQATDHSQFQPLSAARSIIIDPGFIDLTCSSEISIGAFFPGISAVHIAIS